MSGDRSSASFSRDILFFFKYINTFAVSLSLDSSYKNFANSIIKFNIYTYTYIDINVYFTYIKKWDTSKTMHFRKFCQRKKMCFDKELYST